MHDTADMTERHARLLAELAEIGMTIARDLQVQVLQAETPEAKQRAVVAFPRVARAVRQCLALEARLQRDARREAGEVRGEAARDLAARLRRRKTLVTTYMQRAIANDTPDDDDTVAMRMEDLRDRLHDDLLDESFLDQPFDELIAGLHIALGRDLPDFALDEDGDDPPPAADDPPPDSPCEPGAPYSSA